MTPLNGTKTHPLSKHAIDTLRNLSLAPLPRVGMNPGVVNRLLREALVEEVLLPSPYKLHKGRVITHLRVTDAGKAKIS